MFRLFYNYYEDKNLNRKLEIDYCLYKNLQNKNINTVVIESQKHLTFDYFFNLINKITNDEDINIICNSDIYLDDTIILTEKIKENECYALSRWDVHPNGTPIFFDRRDSQDTWIFKGKVKKVIADFTLGKRGCDNRLAYELRRAGYRVTNPSKTIKTYHVHNSNIRSYSFTDAVPEPYDTIDTCYL